MGLSFRLFFAVALCMGLGCGEREPAELFVDLKTDLLPVVEFDYINIEFGEDLSSEVAADSSADYLAGARILETSHAEGDIRVEVQLVRAGLVTLSRAVRVRVEGTTGVTVLMTRDCLGVTCDDPGASECMGGACAPPTCTVESPESCPPPECTSDAECGASVACASARCLEGVCFLDADDATCAGDEICIPDAACAARTRGPGPEVQSTLRINSEGADHSASIVAHPDGGIVVIGYASGLMTSFEYSDYLSTQAKDGFVARFSDDDTFLWARIIGGGDDEGFVDDEAHAVAMDASGNIYVAGNVAGAVTFGDEMTVAAGESEEGYVASWTEDGDYRWVTRFEGGSSVVDVVVDDAETVYATGFVTDDAMVDGRPLSGSGWSAFFLELDGATGGVSDARAFGASGNDAGRALLLGSAGERRIGVSFASGIDFGGGTLATAGGTGVATITPMGVMDEIVMTGGSIEDFAVTADGRTIIVGQTSGPIGLAGDEPMDAREFDVFIASVDALGALQWLHVFGRADDSELASGVTVDTAGNAYVAGEFESVVDFGGGPLYSLGGDEIFLASYDVGGRHRWSRAYGGGSTDYASDVYFDAAGTLQVAASFSGSSMATTAFDDQEIEGGGGTTAVVLRFE